MASTDTSIPPQFHDLLKSCSLDQKKQMLIALNNSISNDIKSSIKSNINFDDYVEHIDQFVPCDFFDEELLTDITELGLFNKKSYKPATQWLSSDSRDYCFSDNEKLKHSPKEICDYPGVCKLMEMVNKEAKTTQDADAALVIVYNTKYSGIDFHNDGESLIDQNSSISTVSFGAPRTVEFCRRGSRPHKAEFSLEAKNHDLMVMKPGCQQNLVHKVCQGSSDEFRVVISFRKLSVPANPNPVTLNISDRDPEVSFDTPAPVKSNAKTIRTISLIAGDSFSAGLDVSKLGRKGRKTVVNVSEGGASIHDVKKQLDEYYLANSSVDIIVGKIFISVGANDIRNCRAGGVRHLKSPLISLSQHIKLLFPDAAVWFQCLIPLPLQHAYSVINVEDYNNLLLEVCSFTKTYYLDMFGEFLYYNFYSDQYYRNDQYFVNSKNIHPNKWGYALMAKHYLKLIHSNKFNPFSY